MVVLGVLVQVYLWVQQGWDGPSRLIHQLDITMPQNHTAFLQVDANMVVPNASQVQGEGGAGRGRGEPTRRLGSGNFAVSWRTLIEYQKKAPSTCAMTIGSTMTLPLTGKVFPDSYLSSDFPSFGEIKSAVQRFVTAFMGGGTPNLPKFGDWQPHHLREFMDHFKQWMCDGKCECLEAGYHKSFPVQEGGWYGLAHEDDLYRIGCFCWGIYYADIIEWFVDAAVLLVFGVAQYFVCGLMAKKTSFKRENAGNTTRFESDVFSCGNDMVSCLEVCCCFWPRVAKTHFLSDATGGGAAVYWAISVGVPSSLSFVASSTSSPQSSWP